MGCWLEHPDIGRLDLDWQDSPGVARVSYEIGFPEVRAATEARVDASGELDLTGFHGASFLTVELRVFGPRRTRILDQLRAFCRPDLRPVFGFERDGEPARRLLLRADSFTAPRTNPGSDQVQVSWRVPSGVQEAYEPQIVTVPPETTVRGGRVYPRSYPLDYDRVLVGASQPTTVTVLGTAPTLPVVRFYGPCQQPRIEHVESGAKLELTRGDPLSIAAGEYVELDFTEHTVRLNGEPAENRYRALAAPSWWELPPGQSRLRFYPVSFSGAASAEVEWRDRWI